MHTIFELYEVAGLYTAAYYGAALGLLSREVLLLAVALHTGAGVVPAGAGTGAGLPSSRPMALATSAR